MDIQPVRTPADHAHAMARLLECLETDPEPGTRAADEAEVWAVLIEKYESEQFPVELPSPIDAIRFRMDQLDMAQKDLAPYIGSTSKVSEVLNGKRALSLAMIRRLRDGLGIPADVLIADAPDAATSTDTTAERLPLKQLHERRYFPDAPDSFREFKKDAKRWVSQLLGETQSQAIGATAFARSSAHYRSNKTLAPTPFALWQTKVLREASHRPFRSFDRRLVDEDFLNELAAHSVDKDGPKRARELLENRGIRVVIEPHLPKTYLDGAALLTEDGPVIGLTLRHDRLDNFWFTLLHEVVHVGWHLDANNAAFFDELEGSSAELDTAEAEADRIAGNALIDESIWRTEPTPGKVTQAWVRRVAGKLGRHPAIVAGRVRRDRKNYGLLSSLVGHRQVRVLFAS